MKSKLCGHAAKAFTEGAGVVSLIIPPLLLLGLLFPAGVEAATYRASVSLASVDGVACPSNAAGPCPAGTEDLVLAAGREHTIEVFFGWDFVDSGGEAEALDNLVNTIEIVALPAEFVSAGEEVSTALTTINAARAALTPPLAAIFAAGIFAPPQFSAPAEGIFSYTNPSPGQGIPFVSAATGSSYPQLARVTYTFPDTASGVMRIQNSHDLGNGVDFYGENPVTQAQILTVNIVRPQLLAELALDTGVDGGILTLTAVIPTGATATSIADADLISADGMATCLDGANPLCVEDLGHEAVISAVTFTLPGPDAITCAGITTDTQTCEGITLTATASTGTVTNGVGNIDVADVQYNLVTHTAGGAVFRAAADIDGTTVPVQVTIAADETPPTVPVDFAASFMCTGDAYIVSCMWANTASDVGSGLDDFEVNLYQGADCGPTVTGAPAAFEDWITPPATASVLGTAGNAASGSYCATLTVQDNAENQAAGSPFTTTLSTVEYSLADIGGNGVPDHLDVFGDYADLDAAVADIGADSDGDGNADSVAFRYGLPSTLDLPSGLPTQTTCAPAYALVGDSMADLTACLDDADEAIGAGVVHVANGSVSTPIAALPLGDGSSGRYLVSHISGNTVTLRVLTVLPQLRIEYPAVRSRGSIILAVDENPVGNPSSPTVFTVMAIGGHIPSTIAVTVAVNAMPEDPPTVVMADPSEVMVVSAVDTFLPTTTALAVHTGIPNPASFSMTASFTVADAMLAGVASISFTFTGITGASTALQTMDTVVEDLVCVPVISGTAEEDERRPCSSPIFPLMSQINLDVTGNGGGVNVSDVTAIFRRVALPRLDADTVATGLARQLGVGVTAQDVFNSIDELVAQDALDVTGNGGGVNVSDVTALFRRVALPRLDADTVATGLARQLGVGVTAQDVFDNIDELVRISDGL